MEKRQFDELLGGDHILPKDTHVLKFLSARGNEIAHLTQELENPQQTKRIFQKLPAHMRRRVMSHNAKRLPRKLREIHIKQMAKAGLPPKTKTPSRKHRRRPRNLLVEYNRRQRNKFWMETHIWHAKRFKMIDKYGYKIPLHSNDRCFRANYRAIKNHCLLQDMSYYTCIELEGQRQKLLEILLDHCNKDTLTFRAKIFANGEREGSLMFFRYKSYPKHPLGNIYFLWNPVNELSKLSTEEYDLMERILWIWIHPAFYNDVLNELIHSFQFIIQSNGNENIEKLDIELQQKEWNNVNTMPPLFELLKTVKNPVYCNKNGCLMTILKNSLNRFRLCGPLALDIIIDALRCPTLEIKKKDENDVLDEQTEKKLKIESWSESYYSIKSNLQALEVQKETVKLISDLAPGQLPPHMVLALSVLDPRFYLPLKREKISQNERQQKRLLEPPFMANNSPLWDPNIRNSVIEQFVASSEINKLRSENLIPGVQNDILFDEDIMSKIPVILIQKTGTTARSLLKNKSNGFTSGIDVILPAAWSMPFWLAFILRCAKSAGLRESLMICIESENLTSPDYYYDPDTEICKREAIVRKEELMINYFRRPPNRRVNFIKYKVAEPFFCNWDLLMKEWVGSSEYSVYRNYKKLRNLQGQILQMKNISMPIFTNEEIINCLIPVRVTLINGGRPKDFAMICLPKSDDILMYKKNKKWTGAEQKQCIDTFEKGRIELRNKHRTLLQRLKKRRIRACKKIKENCTNPLVIKKRIKSIKIQFASIAKGFIDQQIKVMSKMYLPKPKSVRFEGDRETFGYVTKGQFCYSNAIGIGIGYVVAKVLLNLIEQKQNYVLVRNTTSRFYRLAKIDIIN